ncbi:MAG: 50S ribosomal protein L10 [Parachlamydiaceae bacterium]|nr:50S ribosomal protein L10 [Parachlamydiaceae bacterium]
MRPEKELLKKEVKDKMVRHSSFVIMQYGSLKANTANDFRREIGKMGGDVEIVRKRILIKAAEEAGIKLDLSAMQGHIGLVFLGNDPIETTKTVFKFSKDRDQVITVRGGRFEGKLYGGEDVEKMSKLPSRNEMRAQFLSVLEAPMAETLAVMDALLSSVVYCLDNKSKQGSE